MMLVHWIWLSQLKLNAYNKRMLLDHFSDPEDLYCAESESLKRIPEMTEEICKELDKKELESACKILRACGDKDIRILTKQDAAYPKKLAGIADAPLVLYYRGTIPEFDSIPGVGVVGTRKASAYGMGFAYHMAGDLAACGITVISGGASGIDTKAMEGALDEGAGPVAVLGCGVDVVYPKSNQRLFEKVSEKGCLISEYPPGTPGLSWNFPQRNRIISGLSDGVLIVEAPERSGALITANYAVEHGRELFVVPANLNTASAAGSNNLLRSGAKAVLEGWDIAHFLDVEVSEEIRRNRAKKKDALSGSFGVEMVAQEPKLPERGPALKTEADKKDIDKRNKSTYSVSRCDLSGLTQQEQAVYRLVTPEPISADEIIDKSAMASGVVLSALTMLAMKGVIQSHPGRRFSLK